MQNRTSNHTDPNFFNRHSPVFLEMALRTDRIERPASPDGYAKRVGICGDTVEFFFSCHGSLVSSVSFAVQGCLNTIACCNAVAHFAEGTSIESAWEISPDQIINFLETLEPDHFHCAELAVGTFYLALSDLSSSI